MSKLEEALARLEQAVSRLEAAERERRVAEPRAGHCGLQETASEVAARIDSALVRIDRALKGEF